MKRIFALFLCLLLCLPLLPAAAAEDTDRGGTGTEQPNDGSGSCGDEVRWYFNEMSGELKLTGIGSTFNYWDDNYSCPSFADRFRARIRSAVVSSSVTSLGRYLFWNLPKLKEARIGSGVESLGSGVFAECTALSRVVFSGSAPEIPEDAFSGVTATVYYPGDASWDAVRGQNYGGALTWVPELSGGACGKLARYDYYADGLLIVSGSGAIWDYGAENGDAPWAGALLQEAVLDYGVTKIGAEAFSGCTGLTALTLPSSLTGVGAEAFSGCTGLTAFTLPGKVTAIGAGAFSGCTGLTQVTAPASNTAFTNRDGLLLSKDETRLVCCPAGRSGSQSVPASVSGIEPLAFAGCTGLTAIEADAQNESFTSVDGVLLSADGTLLAAYPGGKGGAYEAPASVTEIGAGAFAGCAGLSSVRFFGAAPAFAADSFRGTETEIRYLADQPGWNEAKDRDYGGTLRWTALARPVITVQPESVTAPLGETARFSVEAESTLPMSYQWQYRRNASASWYNSSSEGCKTPTLSVPATAARSGFEFRCRVKNSVGTSYSETVVLNVLTKPAITAQPQGVTANEDASVSFSVTATGADSYQWQYRRNASASWYNSSSDGNKTPTVTMAATAARNGFQFRCRVRNDAGTVYTDAVTLTVVLKPRITAQPQSVSAKKGASVSFSVTATGAETYQWQYRRSESDPWYNCSSDGNKTSLMTMTATAARNGFQFRCRIRNAAGTVYTDIVTLTVK